MTSLDLLIQIECSTVHQQTASQSNSTDGGYQTFWKTEIWVLHVKNEDWGKIVGEKRENVKIDSLKITKSDD